MNIIEIVFQILGFILNTFLFCLSKLSLLYLLNLHTQLARETWIASMTFVLAVPEGIGLIKIIWCSSFLVRDKIRDWPSLPSVLVGIVCSALESVSLPFFLIYIGAKLHPLIFILLSSGIMGVKFISEYFKSGTMDIAGENSNTHRRLRKTIHVIIGVLSIVLVITVSFVTGFSKMLTLSESLILSITLLALSFSWCPGIALFTIRSSGGFVDGRKNASIVYTILKLAIYFIIAITINYIARQDSFIDSYNNLLEGFINITSTKTLRNALIVHSFSGILSHAFTYLSARSCLTRSGIYLPTIFVTPITISLIWYDNFYGIFHLVKITSLSGFTIASWVCLGLTLLLWLLPFLTLGLNHTGVPQSILKRSESNFISYSYNNVFLEYHLHLNYKPEGLYTKYDTTTEMITGVHKVSKVFICTTMYREADFEMERLIKSLLRISLSTKLSYVYIESHLILDNGCGGDNIEEFAQQFLFLLQKMEFTITEVCAYRMPYGLQLQWILDGGVPLFLHLKDPGKVKAKKRWSQVFYMNYILNNRVQKANKFTKDKQKLCKMQSKPLNLRFEINGEPFEGFDSLIRETEVSIQHHVANISKYQIRKDSEVTLNLSTNYHWNRSKNYNVAASMHLNLNQINTGNLSAVNPAFQADLVEIRCNISNSNLILRNQEYENYGNSIVENYSSMNNVEKQIYDRSYILATDADIEFDDQAVLDLLDTINSDSRVGAVSGRTHPIGEINGPITWYQMYEYAKDFWMIKSAQNVIGSVMCCPGCFSMYRATAITELLDEYSSPTKEATDTFIKDTGEDRWMCTLMMLRGWKLKYCTSAFNTTYCPSNMEEFLKQRRRWILSDIANNFVVLMQISLLMRNNASFTVIYFIYLIQMFIVIILSPGTNLVMVMGGLKVAFGFPFWIPTCVVFIGMVAYVIVCTILPSKVQTWVTIIFAGLIDATMGCVIVQGCIFIFGEIARDVQNDTIGYEENYLLILLMASVFYAAILHPREAWIALLGFGYLFMYPGLHVLLPLYSISNIVDQSWGTRDTNRASLPSLNKHNESQTLTKTNKEESRGPSRFDGASFININLMDRRVDDEECIFWTFLRDTLLDPGIRLGAKKEEIFTKLQRLRIRSIFAYLIFNFIWISILGFYINTIDFSNIIGQWQVFASISGVLFGISLFIQIIGMTVHRTQCTIEKVIRILNTHLKIPVWIIPKEYDQMI